MLCVFFFLLSSFLPLDFIFSFFITTRFLFVTVFLVLMCTPHPVAPQSSFWTQGFQVLLWSFNLSSDLSYPSYFPNNLLVLNSSPGWPHAAFILGSQRVPIALVFLTNNLSSLRFQPQHYASLFHPINL